MFENPKRLILTLLAIILFTLGFLFYVWSSLPEVGQETPLETQEESPFQPVSPQGNVRPEGFLRGIQESISPVILLGPVGTIPFFLPQRLFPEFLESGKEMVGEKLLSENSLQGEGVPSGSSASPSLPRKTLSSKEVFERIWPSSYREVLGKAENLVIIHGNGEKPLLVHGDIIATSTSFAAFRDPPGVVIPEKEVVQKWFIPESERTSAFSRDEDIYRSLLTLGYYQYKYGFINEEQYENVLKSITLILPSLIEKERAGLARSQGRQSMNRLGEIFALALNDLASLFSISSPAYAGWYTSPDCYKDDNPAYGVPGFNAIPPLLCCNCGFHFHYSTNHVWIHFHSDCGTNSSGCDIPMGCLNGQCLAWPNAIWDPATGICGCG